MIEKKIYISAELEVLELKAKDVITYSPNLEDDVYEGEVDVIVEEADF